MTHQERQAATLKRIEEQKKRIEKQKEEQLKRALAARARGKAVTGLDALEIKKITREDLWRKKWDKKSKIFDVKLKKRF